MVWLKLLSLWFSRVFLFRGVSSSCSVFYKTKNPRPFGFGLQTEKIEEKQKNDKTKKPKNEQILRNLGFGSFFCLVGFLEYFCFPRVCLFENIILFTAWKWLKMPENMRFLLLLAVAPEKCTNTGFLLLCIF